MKIRDTWPTIPYSLITRINTRRVRQGKHIDQPLDIYWIPSRAVVGGILTIHPAGRDPARYVTCAVVVKHGRLWHLKRDDTGERHNVRCDALRYSCDCHGFNSHGYCRHVDAIAWLDCEGYFALKNGVYIDAASIET